MKVLGLDTATRATAVALAGVGTEVLEARDDPPAGARPGHATRLMPLAAGLLEQAGIGFSELDLIAIGVGPGTFTGLRVGIATARALAQASAVALAPVSTLQSLALGARSWPDVARLDAVVAALDARRGETFAACWKIAELDSLPSALIAPAALHPDVLCELVRGLGLRVLAIGEGAVEFRQALTRSGVHVPEDDSELHKVTAVNHCRLARQMEPVGPEQVHPEYLRLPDAEINRRAAGKQ